MQHHQWHKAIMEMLDFKDSDKYIKSPEQFQQEQQQNQQQAQQSQAQAMAFQQKHETNLAEKKIEGDLMKEAMK